MSRRSIGTGFAFQRRGSNSLNSASGYLYLIEFKVTPEEILDFLSRLKLMIWIHRLKLIRGKLEMVNRILQIDNIYIRIKPEMVIRILQIDDIYIRIKPEMVNRILQMITYIS